MLPWCIIHLVNTQKVLLKMSLNYLCEKVYIIVWISRKIKYELLKQHPCMAKSHLTGKKLLLDVVSPSMLSEVCLLIQECQHMERATKRKLLVYFSFIAHNVKRSIFVLFCYFRGQSTVLHVTVFNKMTQIDWLVCWSDPCHCSEVPRQCQTHQLLTRNSMQKCLCDAHLT